MLYCTNLSVDSKLCKMVLLLDRIQNIRIVSILIDDAMCHGTLMDAEYMEEMKQLILFDCYAFAGQGTTHMTLQNRCLKMKEFISAYKHRLEDPFAITVKPHHALSTGCVEHLSGIMNGEHCDGIIFTPNAPLDQNCFVFKHKMNHSIDLLVGWNDGHNVLYAFDGEDCVILNNNVDEFDCEVAQVWECDVIIDGEQEYYKPAHLRTDKELGNSMRTIERTLKTIKDQVTIHDLVTA